MDKLQYSALVVAIYLFLIAVFAAVYLVIHQNDDSAFVISNSQLMPKIQVEDRKVIQESLSSLRNTQNEVNSKKAKVLFRIAVLNTFLAKRTGLSLQNNWTLLKAGRRSSYYYARLLRDRVRFTNGDVRFVFQISGDGFEELLEYNYFGVSVFFWCVTERKDSILSSEKMQLFPINFQKSFKEVLTPGVMGLRTQLSYALRDFEAEIQQNKKEITRLTQQLKNSQSELNYWDFFYFSTITQTSTGYGDILPNSRVVRGVVTLQIIMGLIILGVVISLHDGDKLKHKPKQV